MAALNGHRRQKVHAANALGAVGATSLAPALARMPLLTSLNLYGTSGCLRPREA